jgi:hypothetical protein
MVKKRRTGYRGIGRDTNAERVVLYTLLGSVLLFTPAVRVIANTAYERNAAVNEVAAPRLEAETPPVVKARNSVLQPKLEPAQPVAAPPSAQHQP